MGLGFRPRLAQRVGLSFAASFGHGLGKVGEQHREPEPQCDLQVESEAHSRCAEKQGSCDYTAHLHHEHDRVPHHGAGIQLNDRIPERATHYAQIPYRPFFFFAHKLQKVLPACSSRCSRMGPRLSAGKNVNAPTIRITETSKIENSGVVTGKVPSDGGTAFLRARLPAIPRMGMIMKKRPIIVFSPSVVLYQNVFPFRPAKAEPLFPAVERKA